MQLRLFGRRPAEPTQIDTNGSWTVSEGTYDGRPLILRLNTGLEPLVGNRRYRYQAGIAVICNAPDERGFPSEQDLEALGIFEDEFVRIICGDTRAILAAIVTTNGMREFVFYCTDEAVMRERFQAWVTTLRSHKAQLMVKGDPDWSTYQILAGRR